MDAWQRRRPRRGHARDEGVLERRRAARPGGDCCGALHMHAGLTTTQDSSPERVMRSMPGDAPIVVDSAGCGAALKDYGHLLGTPEAEAFSGPRPRRPRMGRAHWTSCRGPPRPRPTVVVQDPCHLRHVQRAHCPVRTVLQPYVARSSSSTTKDCAVAPVARTRRSTPSWPAEIRDRKVDASIGPRPTSSRAPIPGARCTSPPRASRSAIRWSSSTRRSMDGEFDESGNDSRRSPRSSTDLAIDRPARSRSTRAAASYPSTSGG